MTTSDIKRLAERLARGEEAAFAELYDLSADRLYHYLVRFVRSRETAADVLQTAFMKAVKNRRRFRGVENPVAYLFQIARNEAVRARTRTTKERPLEMAQLTAVSATTEQSDIAEAIAVVFATLSDEDREIVHMKVFSLLTFREIGEVLGLPLATVATKYRRAIDSVQPLLEKQLR